MTLLSKSLKIACLTLLMFTGTVTAEAQGLAYYMVRNAQSDCMNTDNYFYVANCSDCSSFRWSVAGSHINVSGSYTGSTLTLRWTQINKVVVNVTFNVGGTGQGDDSWMGMIQGDVTATVSLSSPAPACAGTPVQLTATPTNGGASPIYDFKVNSLLQQSGSSNTFTRSNFNNNDKVTVVLRSSLSCANSPTADKWVTINALPSIPSAPDHTITCGGSLILTASGAGTNETYKWYTQAAGGSSTTGSYPTGQLSAGTHYYYVSKVNTNTFCESPRKTVTVISNPLGAPSTQNVTIPYNTSTTLIASNAAPGETYKWYYQDSHTGYTGSYPTPVLNGSPTYVYKVTRYNPTTNCETPFTQAVPLTVTLVVHAPPPPSVSANTCGPKTITLPIPPDGVTWYWQGTNPNGQLVNNPVSSSYTFDASGPHYIRGRANNINLWSSATAIGSGYASVDPVDIAVDAYNPSTNLVQATHQIRLLPGFTVTAGNTFTARIAITSECNDYVNWTEQVIYNESATPIANSKEYYDGLGRTLLSQHKDYLSKKVFASQPIYDTNGVAAAGTLAAPILEHDFIYKNNFIRNESGQAYSANDFDLRTTSNAPGEINYPKAVGEQPGTVGWYYSSNNNLEPNTPVTDYPYARSYTPEGPDPKITKSSGAGDVYRMGSGHEVTSERQLIAAGDLAHYLALRPHFVFTSLPVAGYKFIATDPDGKKAVSFVDADGRTLATATLAGSAYDNWSYSYYNDLGQLVASVAPNGVNTASTAYPQFVTLYKYDHLGRLIETTSPDEGTSKFIYSTDGKIRFSQNQEQYNANPKRFSYTNYDYLGRLVESGEYKSTSGGYFFEPSTAAPSDPLSVLHLADIDIARGYDIDDLNASVSPSIFKGPSAKIDLGRCADYTFVKYDLPALAPGTQNNLEGQVSKTENQHSLTWYSYDEFGQVVKTWQRTRNSAIVSPVVTVTITYTYDYFGNVTEVYYQRDNTSDKFYHYYTYDKNNRLTEVRTSTDGTNKTLQAGYQYYLHGPLKRMVLANGLQNIDYTYTLDGSLKSINHADPAKDPGGDGANDVFGETLHYFDGDYRGAGYNAGTQTGIGSDQFGGLLKAMSWHSPAGNHEKQTYSYQYSSLNFLTNAVWGTMSGTAGAYGFNSSSNQNESAGNYDKNGNIGTMFRTGKDNNTIANYGYVYETGTNKLDKVNHNGSQLVDYTYNAIGQMIKQDEGTAKNFDIVYNAYGLVSQVRKVVNSSSIVLQTYLYDDRGNLFQRVLHDANGLPQKRTTYISDVSGNTLAIYESNTTTLASAPIEVPIYGAGRMGVYKPGVSTFYEVSDHLGNVRAVIGSPQTMTVTATMETANQSTEQNQFLRYPNVRIVNAAIFDHTNGAGSQNSIRLSGSANEKTGLVRSFSVSPGDVVKLEVYAKYVDNDRTNVSATLNSLVNAIAGGVAAPGTVIDGAGYATNSSNPFLYTGLLTPSSASGPKAYLNYLFFDRNFVFQLNKSGFVPVTQAARENGSDVAHEKLTTQLNITEPGYVYAYLSNDSPTPIEVYFDDFSVTHDQSAVVAGADYYPFGLAMENREITDEPYRYGYQGQFSEKDITTGMQEFELRNYDARIGRWLSPDPYGQHASPYMAMGNAPHMSVDPNGGYNLPAITIMATSYATIAANVGMVLGRGLMMASLAGGPCPKCPNPSDDPELWTEGTSYTMNGTEYILEKPSLGRDGWVRVGGDLKEVTVGPSKGLKSFGAGILNPFIDVATTLWTSMHNGYAHHFNGQGNYNEWYSYKVDENGFYKNVDQNGFNGNDGSQARNAELMTNTVSVNLTVVSSGVNIPLAPSQPVVNFLGNQAIKQPAKAGLVKIVENALSVH